MIGRSALHSWVGIEEQRLSKHWSGVLLASAAHTCNACIHAHPSINSVFLLLFLLHFDVDVSFQRRSTRWTISPQILSFDCEVYLTVPIKMKFATFYKVRSSLLVNSSWRNAFVWRFRLSNSADTFIDEGARTTDRWMLCDNWNQRRCWIGQNVR